MNHVTREEGNEYSRLVVFNEAGRTNKGAVLWECACECGETVIVPGAYLRQGGTQSCGCLRRENAIEKFRKESERNKLTKSEITRRLTERRRCGRCQKIKPPSGFNGSLSPCRECKSKSTAAWSKKNPEKMSRKYRRRGWKKKFGLTEQGYNTLYEVQCGKCAICQRHQDELPRVLSVDHCHVTGRVRGLLCARCNSLLGMACDRQKVLRSAILYLNKVQST